MRRLEHTPTVTGTFSMGSKRKVFEVRLDHDIKHQALIISDSFDDLIDRGYDDILIVCPTKRYIASIDEWLDYGYIDLDGDVEVRVLHKSYMGLV